MVDIAVLAEAINAQEVELYIEKTSVSADGDRTVPSATDERIASIHDVSITGDTPQSRVQVRGGFIDFDGKPVDEIDFKFVLTAKANRTMIALRTANDRSVLTYEDFIIYAKSIKPVTTIPTDVKDYTDWIFRFSAKLIRYTSSALEQGGFIASGKLRLASP